MLECTREHHVKRARACRACRVHKRITESLTISHTKSTPILQPAHASGVSARPRACGQKKDIHRAHKKLKGLRRYETEVSQLRSARTCALKIDADTKSARGGAMFGSNHEQHAAVTCRHRCARALNPFSHSVDLRRPTFPFETVYLCLAVVLVQ